MATSISNLYMDYAAATPLDPGVLEAMRPYLEAEFANPSSLYGTARTTRQAVESARATVADLLGAKTTEIVWTSGGTEGANLAIQGVLRANPGAHWIATNIEHDAVLANIEPSQAGGHSATIMPVKPNGIVDPANIRAAITDDTVLITVMLANNEIGTIQPVGEIGKIIRTIRADRAGRGIDRPLYLYADATQAPNYLDLHVERLGVDLLSLSGSKIYGPKGTGLLYIRQSTRLEPLMYGGGQERGRRSGTENVPGIVGLAAALKLAQVSRDAESRRLGALRDQALAALSAALPGLILNGDPKRRLPNNLNLTLSDVEGEGLVLYLDQQGIQASTGSACSTGDLDPSHVLLALGRTTAEANSSLRLTLGRHTDEAAINHLVTVLPPIVARLRELAT